MKRRRIACPQCAARAEEERFLFYVEQIAARLTEYAKKKRDRAARLIAAGFELAEIVEMTGLSEEGVAHLTEETSPASSPQN